MRETAAARLETLRQESEAGTKMLADLDAQRLELQQTLLRIAGAIQILEELLADSEEPSPNGTTSAETPLNASA